MVDYLSELANTEEELIVYILLSANSPCLTRVNKRFREIYVRNENRLIVRHIEPAFTEYKLFGKCHRDNDLPAIVYADRTQMWCKDGEYHRDNNLPAVIYANGIQKWYRHGKLHRDNDLPAIIHASGIQKWYQHGKLHRDNNLPAVIHDDGYQAWYRHGKAYKN